MTHLDLVERVRHTVRATMVELTHEPAEQLQETILIRDGFYCGRRFQSDHMQAIWFIEEDELKFYAVDGGVVRVSRVMGTPHTSTRRVA